MSQSVLASLYSRSLAVDVVLKVEGDKRYEAFLIFLNVDSTQDFSFREIKAHRNILMGASEYFEALFTAEFKEKDSEEIILKEIRFGALKTLIDFIYTGELTLRCTFLEAVMAADYLMIDCVMVKLNKHAANATVDNCIDIYGAHEYLDAGSNKTVLKLIRRNCSRLMHTKKFSTLSVDQLRNILTNSIHALSQTYAITAINLWVLAAPEDRYQHVGKLLSKVVFKTTMDVSRMEIIFIYLCVILPLLF